MDFDQENNLVLSVLRAQDQQWHVCAQDLRQPLATFDVPQAACAWAVARAHPKHGRVFVEELATDISVNKEERIKAADSFKFSIPVAWTNSKNSRYGAVRR